MSRVIIGYIAKDVLARNCKDHEYCVDCPHSRRGKEIYECCLGDDMWTLHDPTISVESAMHLIIMCRVQDNCLKCQYHTEIGNGCSLREATGLHPKNWRNLEGKWRVAVMGGIEDGKY